VEASGTYGELEKIFFHRCMTSDEDALFSGGLSPVHWPRNERWSSSPGYQHSLPDQKSTYIYREDGNERMRRNYFVSVIKASVIYVEDH
jgi:hypothetical protein